MATAEHELNLNSQNAPHTSPLRASYGVFLEKILEKIDRVNTASLGGHLIKTKQHCWYF